MSQTEADGLAPGSRVVIAILAGAGAVGMFFRGQIGDGFHLLFSDTYDGLIELSILEHWNNVFHGVSAWSRTNYFFPTKLTLGYNDGYFIYGVIHSFFRLQGVDPFLSGELVNVVVRAFGFWAFYAACQRILRLDWRFSLLGAAIFTLSNSSYNNMDHTQLLSVCFAPAMAMLLRQALLALGDGRRRTLLIAGGAFVVGYAAWLMTAYYMAWYFLFFTTAFLPAYACLGPTGQWRAFLAGVRRQWPSLCALLALAVIVNLPFLSVYLHKAKETGMRPFAETMVFSPTLLDVAHVGAGNLLYGWLDLAVRGWLKPGHPAVGGLTTGFPVLTLTLFVCSIVWLWRRPEANRSVPLMRAIAAATIVTWALTLHAGPFSAYPIVYYGFPGAKVIRVLARYQLFLAVPVIALGTAFLAGQAKRLPRWLVLALSVLLLAEQINRFPIRWIDRPAELARMAAVPAAPAGCAAFFISREEKDPWSPVDGLYRHSVDAMLLAELRRLPTINGIASFLPPDYDLFNPDQPAYVDKVRRYSAEHDLQGLCGLDFRTKTWQTSP